MTPKPKTFCLAFLVASVLSAAAAAQSPAHTFYADGPTAHLTAEAKTPQEVIATPVDETYFKCNKISATGTIEGEEAESITITPEYAECGVYEGETKLASIFVEMKSCHYVFGGETTETKLGNHAAAEIECTEPGGHIEVTATALKFKCISVPEQEVQGLHYEDGESKGVDDISVEATITGLDSSTTNSLACPTKSGGTETHNNGTLIGKVTLTAHNEKKEATGISTTPPTHDFQVSEAGTLTAKALNAQIFKSETASEDQVSCTEVSATGTLSGTSSELTATPSYTNCKVKKGEIEALAFTESNKCDYLFTGATTSGNPTGGEHATLSIKDTSGTGTCHIETKVSALKIKCISIPNQELQNALRYEVDPSDNKSFVMKVTAHGLDSTTTNSAACPTPEGKTVVHENGLLTGEITVSAHNEALQQVPITLKETG